jgi:phosphatidylinositol alpha-mannosyltransferase
MRIAIVHPFLWPNVRRGGERYLDDLTWYLVGAGHDVDVITGAEPGPAEANGARVHRVRYPRGARLFPRGLNSADTFALAAMPRLRRRYDVVHAFTPSGALAARALRQRTLLTLLGHPVPEIFEGPAHRRLVATAVRRATMVAALSRASAEQCRRTFGRLAEVLSPGVRLERFEARLQARTGAPRILFPAAALPQKGLGVLLIAMEHVLATMPEARLIVAGPGDPSWALDRLGAARAAVEAAVDVVGIGSPEDLVRRYRDATVTVLPSRDDAFGLVLVESLACGTPVVCCDAGGMPEIVEGAEVGRIARVGDAAALADAIVEAIVLAGRPGTPGLCRARAERWDWTGAIGPAHEALYRRIVGA